MPDRLKPALVFLAALLPLAACGSQYSPDTYATRAVQQANKAEQGVIVGVRPVNISAGGETGATAGAAAGGVLGAQAPGGGIFSALGGVGGALIGGLAGTAAEHRVVDTTAYEYVVRITGKNELVSVTQKDQQPLALGLKVLVIGGNQARIVPDYTMPQEAGTAAAPPTAAAPTQEPAEEVPEAAEPPKAEAAQPLIPLPGIAAPATAYQVPPPVLVPNPAPPIPMPAGS